MEGHTNCLNNLAKLQARSNHILLYELVWIIQFVKAADDVKDDKSSQTLTPLSIQRVAPKARRALNSPAFTDTLSFRERMWSSSEIVKARSRNVSYKKMKSFMCEQNFENTQVTI